jgi:SAM-dependent methyltransferase
MTPDPAKVRSWDERAEAYDALCRRWEVFTLLSTRLIDMLPDRLDGDVLDIGAGSGLTSCLLLDRHPECRVILVEPAHAMIDIARRHLAGRPARFLATGLDGPAVGALRAVAALASASMQFLDLEPAFATLARIVEPGGHVAFNLWYHHWEETAGRDDMGMYGWIPIAKDVCREAGVEMAPPPPRPVPKQRADLMDATRRHGFELLAEQRDQDPSPVAYGVDFMAMDKAWPAAGLDASVRDALLRTMRDRAEGKVEAVGSTRFVFRAQA